MPLRHSCSCQEILRVGQGSGGAEVRGGAGGLRQLACRRGVPSPEHTCVAAEILDWLSFTYPFLRTGIRDDDDVRGQVSQPRDRPGGRDGDHTRDPPDGPRRSAHSCPPPLPYLSMCAVRVACDFRLHMRHY
eukprot:COSAG01_NODE_13368_length_1595_cov_1.072861_1_plen_132_part_00